MNYRRTLFFFLIGLLSLLTAAVLVFLESILWLLFGLIGIVLMLVAIGILARLIQTRQVFVSFLTGVILFVLYQVAKIGAGFFSIFAVFGGPISPQLWILLILSIAILFGSGYSFLRSASLAAVKTGVRLFKAAGTAALVGALLVGIAQLLSLFVLMAPGEKMLAFLYSIFLLPGVFAGVLFLILFSAALFILQKNTLNQIEAPPLQ